MKEIRNSVKIERAGRHVETEPERRFKNAILRVDMPYDVYQWYVPRKHNKDFKRNYEIDFAIPELKLSFEVNGNFHYNTATWKLKDYYVERKAYIESFGWKQIDIHYLICFNDEKLKMIINDALGGKFKFEDEIINEIKCYYDISHLVKKVKKEIDPEKILNSLGSKSKDGKQIKIDTEVHDKVKEYQLQKLKEYLQRNPGYACDEEYLDEYINSLRKKKVKLDLFDRIIANIELLKSNENSIDYKQKGYNSKLMKVFGMTRHGVRLFLQNYITKFYNDRCYNFDKNTNSLAMKTYEKNMNAIREARKNQILNSGIDFKKEGWVNKLLLYIGLKKRSSILRWLKRNMNEFYTENIGYDKTED